MKVNIKGETLDFEIGTIWGVVYDFETLTDGRMAFDLSRTAAVHIAMYGVLLRCNPGMALTMEEFVEELNNIALAKAMTGYFVKRFEILSQGEAVAHAVKEEQKKEEGGDDGQTKAPDEEEKAEPGKKKEPTGADPSTDTRCTGQRLGAMAWIRRIFSRS